MAGRTAIVIAHRLSTVRGMNRILVFDHGQIVEEGNHESLLRRPHGHYHRLFARQSGQIARETPMLGLNMNHQAGMLSSDSVNP